MESQNRGKNSPQNPKTGKRRRAVRNPVARMIPKPKPPNLEPISYRLHGLDRDDQDHAPSGFGFRFGFGIRSHGNPKRSNRGKKVRRSKSARSCPARSTPLKRRCGTLLNWNWIRIFHLHWKLVTLRPDIRSNRGKRLRRSKSGRTDGARLGRRVKWLWFPTPCTLHHAPYSRHHTPFFSALYSPNSDSQIPKQGQEAAPFEIRSHGLGVRPGPCTIGVGMRSS